MRKHEHRGGWSQQIVESIVGSSEEAEKIQNFREQIPPRSLVVVIWKEKELLGETVDGYGVYVGEPNVMIHFQHYEDQTLAGVWHPMENIKLNQEKLKVKFV